MTEESQLLFFASLLPWHERCVFKELVLDRSPRVFDPVRRYNATDPPDRTALKRSLLEVVIAEVVDRAHDVYARVFRDMSVEKGKQMAEGDKAGAGDPGAPALVYGEIDFFSFAALLEGADPQEGEVFVDLGSGTGKAVVAAALLYGHKFRRCVGIELLPTLFKGSLTACERYREEDGSLRALFGEERAAVSAYCGDILAEELPDEGGGFSWVSADVIFINSTCFDAELMDKISAMAERLRSGARIITLTRPLQSERVQLLVRKQMAMSWGPATGYIQRVK